MSTEENKAVIKGFFEEFSKGNTDRINEFFASDYVYNGPGGYTLKGIESLKNFTIWLHSNFPTLNFTLDDLVAEGDKVVTLFTMKGADTRNKDFSAQGIIISRLLDGKVVEDREIFDRFEMASQLAPGWAKAFLNLIEKKSTKGRP